MENNKTPDEMENNKTPDEMLDDIISNTTETPPVDDSSNKGVEENNTSDTTSIISIDITNNSSNIGADIETAFLIPNNSSSLITHNRSSILLNLDRTREIDFLLLENQTTFTKVILFMLWTYFYIHLTILWKIWLIIILFINIYYHNKYRQNRKKIYRQAINITLGMAIHLTLFGWFLITFRTRKK